MNFIHALILATALFGTSAATPAGSSFSLKVFEGFRFSDCAVVKSDDKSADVRFYYQVRRAGPSVYLGAEKIKELAAAPGGPFSTAETTSWKDYVFAPGPGYYGVVSKGHSYVLHLESYENQGKAASYWRVNFSWKQLD
jgi:hypothetical protein